MSDGVGDIFPFPSPPSPAQDLEASLSTLLYILCISFLGPGTRMAQDLLGSGKLVQTLNLETLVRGTGKIWVDGSTITLGLIST